MILNTSNYINSWPAYTQVIINILLAKEKPLKLLVNQGYTLAASPVVSVHHCLEEQPNSKD